MDIGSVFQPLTQGTVESSNASDGWLLFIIQLIPFVVLLMYIFLEGRESLSVSAPAEEHAPKALRRILQIQGLPVENIYKKRTASTESPTETEDQPQISPDDDSDDETDSCDRNQMDTDADATDINSGTVAATAGDTPKPVEIDHAVVDEIAENESAQGEIIQVAVTAADQVHLPAQFIGLAIAGGALMIGELLQTPDTPMRFAGRALSVTRQDVAGLILIGYFALMLLTVALTMRAFQRVDPGLYYPARVKNQRDVSLSSVWEGDDTFTRWYQENASQKLMPLIHVFTLLLIILIYLI
jgi:hypothetical protein